MCACVLCEDMQIYLNICCYSLCLVPEGVVPDDLGSKATLPASPYQGFQSPLNASRERAAISC